MSIEKISRKEIEELLNNSKLSNKKIKEFFTTFRSFFDDDEGNEHWYKKVVTDYIYEEEYRFNRGHFPIGTVAKAKIFENEGEFEFTVLSLTSNSPSNWIVETNLPCQVVGNRKLSIGYVTRIVERGKGPLKVADEFQEDRRDLLCSSNGKYGFYEIDALVWDLYRKHHKPTALDDHLIDVERLARLVKKELRISYASSFMREPMTLTEFLNSKTRGQFFISKKKMDRLINRLLPRCKRRRKDAAREEDEEMRLYYARQEEMETDFDY